MYKFAINRPITTLMMVLALIVFGSVSYKTMPINLFPNIDFPNVTVETAYYGADPETVESKVTDRLEEVLSGIDGIDKLTSTSYEGLSVILVQFDLGKDIDEAANDVRDKIGGVSLGSEVEKPVVKKVSASGGSVIKLFIASKSGDTGTLMRFADEKVKPKLQRVRGVGEVHIVGYRDREVRIFADPFMLNKYGISASELQNIVAVENVRAGGGKLIGAQSESIIKLRGDAQSIEQMRAILIRPGVRLGDIARVEDGLSDAKSYSSYAGKSGVMLEVKKIAGTNTLEIINGVKKSMPVIESLAGDSFELLLLEDQSEKIMVNFYNVTFDLIFGAFLAVIIVFFFLRNLTATLVAALAIPTSIIGTFAFIDYLGYDMNRLTMIGLTLAIGIFIDDAIVVIENITKKMEKGMGAFDAAFEGIREIAFSILAISAMLLAVFIPVAYMGGIVGKFFNSFAMTVAVGIVISYFVAVMFVPAVGARFLNSKESRFWHWSEPLFQRFDRAYASLLRPLIRYKSFTLLAAVAILVASGMLGGKVGMDFVPMEDNSEMRVIVKAPVGISLEHMKEKMSPIAAQLDKDANILYTVLSIGYTSAQQTHKAMIYAKLLPVTERNIGQEQIVQNYRERFSGFDKELQIMVEEVPSMDTGESNAPIQIVITGPDMQKLSEVSGSVRAILEQTKGVVDIDSDLEAGKPEIRITILRESAQRMGVSAQAIAGILGAAYSSDTAISTYEDLGKAFDVTLRLSDENRALMDDLKKLQVRSQSGAFVSLEGLVKFEATTGAASINRFDRERKVLVTSNIFETTLDEVVSSVETQMKKLLPEGYRYRFTGDIERMAETNAAFGMAVLAAVVLIYLILAALYESLIQPLIIMVAMPLSITGVMLALYLSGNPFSLFVMIGLILLLGMVGKNAVLVVDFANQAIKAGKDVESALVEAGEKRLRPILMTTFAMIGAMLPLAFGGGAGHESNAPMALAIIGGLLSSTLLTLLVVPAIYRLMYPLDAWLRRFYEKGEVR